jgi:hypothetical protein
MKAAIAGALRDAGAPLLSYYAIAVAVPVLNGARFDGAFFEHVGFVVVVPLVLVTSIGVVRGWPR